MFIQRQRQQRTLGIIRHRLVGCRFELEQSCEEARLEHLGAHLTNKLDRALLEVSGAMRQVEETRDASASRGERQP